MKQISYPKIPQFRNVVSAIKHQASYVGQDDDGQPIYDGSIRKPILTARGTVKIHGCFSKDSLVTLPNGDSVPISKIKVGDEILSYDLENHKHVTKKVLNTFERDLDKKWIKLHFDNGSFIECTEDHKIWTSNRGFVEAKNLTPDDDFVIDFE